MDTNTSARRQIIRALKADRQYDRNAARARSPRMIAYWEAQSARQRRIAEMNREATR